MAAFRRRTGFAAPLIVIASCGGKDAPKDPRELGGTSWQVWKQGDACRADLRIDCPKDVACNPPAPREIECPAGVTDKVAAVVVEKPDKTCAIVPAGCKSVSCATPATPCPVPYGEPPRKPAGRKLTAIWTVMRVRVTPELCDVYDDLACQVPQGQPAPPCNPPPPQRVPCPATMPDQGMRIGQLPSGECAAAPAPCADASCVKAAIACPIPKP